MKIHKIIEKLKSFSTQPFKKYREENGVRYYTINKHIARVEFDERTGFYIGVFEQMRAMSDFSVYYESDIPSTAREALQNYLSHCRSNNLNPYRE